MLLYEKIMIMASLILRLRLVKKTRKASLTEQLQMRKQRPMLLCLITCSGNHLKRIDIVKYRLDSLL